jgi:hypothetical protein
MSRAADDNFLARWSRLKRAGEPLPAPLAKSATPAAPSRPLPDPASLTFDDDFSQFLGAEVAEGVKRVALRKLFHSPAFNVMDGLDVYIDDYSLPDPLDEAMLKALNHAQGLVFDVEEKVAEEAAPLAAEASLEPLAEPAELTGDADAH